MCINFRVNLRLLLRLTGYESTNLCMSSTLSICLFIFDTAWKSSTSFLTF